MKYSSFTEMPIWKRANELAVEIYKETTKLPRSEDYGLTSQIRRSSNGVAACIAEGFGRNTNKDKSYFYLVARGSAYETQNHLIYATNVGYIENEKLEILFKSYDQLIFDLNKLMKYLSEN